MGHWMQHRGHAIHARGVAARVVGWLVASALLLPPAIALAVEIAPDDCGRCHVRQFRQWSRSPHKHQNVECGACHGELHSATIVGCRDQCHVGKHGLMFRDWEQVQRLDPPNSDDYVCSVCHHAHRGGLLESKDGCKACHNPSTHASVVEMHAGLLESMFPTENDGFAMLEAQSRPMGRLVWMHDSEQGSRLKRIGAMLLMGAESVVVFFGLSLLLFPLMLAVLMVSGRR